MGSLGSHGDKMYPDDGWVSDSAAQLCDTQCVDFDSQYSPPVFSEETDALSDGFRYMDDTVPVEDDTVPAHGRDDFETQQVEFDCETQLLDLAEETQVVDLPGEKELGIDGMETQVVDLPGEKEFGIDGEETQVIDLPGEKELGIDGMETQVIDLPGEKELGIDGICCSKDVGKQSKSGREEGEEDKGSDGEHSDRTEVLSDCETGDLTDFDVTNTSDGRTPGAEMVNPGSLDCRDDTRTKSPFLDVAGSPPGYHKKGFASIRAKSLRASGRAARFKGSLKGIGVEPCCDKNSDQSFAQHEELVEVNKAKFGSSVSRKLFTEDMDIDENDHCCNNTLAGLSYVNSQEPGEDSQASALDFVDRFIKASIFEYDQDARHGTPAGEKTDPAFSGKGVQSLAKKVKHQYSHPGSGIYDWNDNLEDEGGGGFFSRKKGSFFHSSVKARKSCTEPRKPRKGRPPKRLKNEELQIVNAHKTTIGLARSEPNLSKVTRKVGRDGSGSNIRRNLNSDLDEQLPGKPRSLEAEAEAVSAEMRYGPDVGFDTQLAAEAIEALSNADRFIIDSNVPHQNEKTCEKKIKKVPARGNALKQHSTLKRYLSDSGVVTRSKRSKTCNDQSVEASKSAVASRTRSRKEQRQVVEAKAYGLDRNEASTSFPNEERVSDVLQNVRDEEENEAPIENLDDNGSPPTKGRLLGERRNTNSLVAQRTRKSMVYTHGDGLDGSSNERTERRQDLGTDGPVKKKALDLRTGKDVTRHDGLISGGGLVENKSAQVNESKRTEDLLMRSSTVDPIGKTIARKRSKRTIRSADLAKYGKFYARKAVSALALPRVLPPSENKHGCSRTAKKIEAKLPPKSSPAKMMELPNLACTPPVHCRTPIKSASPVCMGDEYYKVSCKKKASGPTLLKELNSLTPSPRCTVSDKGMRKRRDMASIRVLFSHHLDQDIIRHQKKILARLGISEASSILEATHFVTDEFVRTRNMLEAIARGIPVVTHLWVENCGQASCYLDEKNYILRDTRKEKEIGFSMPVSLALANQQPLLQGKRVLITSHTKPGVEILSSLVKAVHGQATERIGRSVLNRYEFPDDLIVLSCEEDYEACVPFLEKGAPVYSSELLLNGIVLQKLEFTRHRLFEDHIRRTRSTTWLKKDGRKFLPVTRRK